MLMLPRTTASAPDRTSYADLVAAVPSDVAMWAATHHGALIAATGTCGETGAAWRRIGGRWYADDGYAVVPADEDDLPEQVEVVDWPGQQHRAAELNRLVDKQIEAEYSALGKMAERDGDTAEFHAALAAACDAYEVDESLYEKLTCSRAEQDPGEYERDEDETEGIR